MKNDTQKLTSLGMTRQDLNRVIFAICMVGVIYIRFTYCPNQCPVGRENAICGVLIAVETLLMKVRY